MDSIAHNFHSQVVFLVADSPSFSDVVVVVKSQLGAYSRQEMVRGFFGKRKAAIRRDKQ